MADLDGAVKWAGDNGGNLKKVAITGFCWGGRITWLYAEQSKNVKAGVAWYGLSLIHIYAMTLHRDGLAAPHVIPQTALPGTPGSCAAAG